MPLATFDTPSLHPAVQAGVSKALAAVALCYCIFGLKSLNPDCDCIFYVVQLLGEALTYRDNVHDGFCFVTPNEVRDFEDGDTFTY